MEYSYILVKRIRELAETQNLSITSLAKVSGVKQSTLDNIMQGNTKNPGIINIHKLANAFGMTLSEFLDIKELNEYIFEDETAKKNPK